jgi:hypothetical protein
LRFWAFYLVLGKLTLANFISASKIKGIWGKIGVFEGELGKKCK